MNCSNIETKDNKPLQLQQQLHPLPLQTPASHWLGLEDWNTSSCKWATTKQIQMVLNTVDLVTVHINTQVNLKLTYLSQIFNGVNIMMRGRADKANTRHRLTSLGNLFRHLSRNQRRTWTTTITAVVLSPPWLSSQYFSKGRKLCNTNSLNARSWIPRREPLELKRCFC